MYISNHPPRQFDPDRPTGSAITVGNIAKISDAVEQLGVKTADLIAKTKSTLADLERRISHLEEKKDEHARWGRRA